MPQGVGSTAVYLNVSGLKKLGVTEPDGTWTWDSFAELATAISKDAPKGVYGATDVWAPGGGAAGTFEVYVRQRGKNLYTNSGKLGFSKDDLSEWLDFWDKLRKSGAVTPPQLTAGANSSDGTSPLVTGSAMMYFSFTGILVGLQDLTPNQLTSQLMPNGPAGSKPGQALVSDGPLAVYSKTQDPEDAAKLLDFLINDPSLDELINTQNGVPINKRRRDVLKASATGAAKQDLAYMDAVSAHSTPLTIVPPLGSSEFASTTLQKAHEDVAFGRASIKDAVDTVFTSATQILNH
jgi:multiple sugar transport system substrate-binding protein